MSNWQDGLPPRVRERLSQIEETAKGEQDLYIQEGITQEAFLRAVQKMMRREKLPFILAVYQIFYDLVTREQRITGIALACQKGCSSCCHELITCTEMEITAVIDFINSFPKERRIALVEKVQRYLKEWGDYFQQNKSWLTLSQFPLQLFQDWSKPCVFLREEDGSCEIYPVRIIDCRTLTSLSPCNPNMTVLIPCKDPHYQGPGRMRFQAEIWANNLVLEEQKRRLGHMNVVPILHWLLLKKSKLGI